MHWKVHYTGEMINGKNLVKLNDDMSGSAMEIHQYVRSNMKIADTYQEQNEDGTMTDMLTYEDMLKEWALIDGSEF